MAEYELRVCVHAPDYYEIGGGLKFVSAMVYTGMLNISGDTAMLLAQSAVSHATGLDLDVIEENVIEATFIDVGEDQPVWLVAIHDGGGE